jgi:cell division septation protein DedD
MPDADKAREFVSRLRASGRIAYICDDAPHRVELVD